MRRIYFASKPDFGLVGRCALFLMLMPLQCVNGTTAGRAVVVTSRAMLNGKLLAPDAVVSTGDLVTTTQTSRVKLLMVDQSVIDIGPQSQLKIGRYAAAGNAGRDVEVDVEFGAVRALISRKKDPSKVHFRTKWGVLAVRGTEIVLDVAAHLNLIMLSGAAQFTYLLKELAGREALSLSKGQKLALLEGISEGVGQWSPEVTVLTPEELANYEERRIPDDTFAVASSRASSQVAGRALNTVLPNGSGWPSVKSTMTNPLESLKTPSLAINPANVLSATVGGNAAAAASGGDAGPGDGPVGSTAPLKIILTSP